MKRTLTLIAILLLEICAYAYYPIVKNYNKEDYNAKAQNWSIAQSSSGNIWFANSGILEFDGKDWELTKTLNLTTVRSVTYDKNNMRLYFGATDEVGYLHEAENSKIEYVSLRDSLKTYVGEIWGIHQLNGILWLRENNNIYAYGNNGTRTYAFDNKITTSTVINGQLYIYVTHQGLLKLCGETFKEVKGSEQLRDIKISIILPTHKGLILGTESNGVYELEKQSLRKRKDMPDEELAKAAIYCGATNEKFTAFGTIKDGVFIKSNIDGTTIHLNTDSGLQNNTVLSMMFDKNGNLWLGLDNGISLVRLDSPEYNLLGSPKDYGAGYAAAKYNDKLWFGTNQGLFNQDKNGKISPYLSGQVWDLAVIDGDLFCSHDNGLYIIEGNVPRHIPINGTWKVARLRKNPEYILGCSYDKLFLLKKYGNNWNFYGWIDGFDEASKVFEEDKDGKIWFSHWVKGLYRLTLDTQNKTVTDIEFKSRNEGFPEDWGNTPIRLHNDIIFSTAKGYYSYDNISGKAVPHEKLNNIFPYKIGGTGIYSLDNGDMYFSSDKIQALYYKDKDGSYIIDSLSLKGLTTRRIFGFEMIMNIDNDQILVNTEDGFSIINSKRMKEERNDKNFNVFIKDISVLNSGRDSSIFSSRNDSICRKSLIVLPFSDNSLRIKASMPFYKFSDKVRYSFFLKGYDKGWSPFSEADYREYTKIPRGDYTMMVRALSPDSMATSESCIKVRILAPWYETVPAYITYILILSMVLFLIYKWAESITTRRARAEQEEKKKIMQEKQVRMELEHKAQDLAASTMNLIRKNEILLEINNKLAKATDHIVDDRNKSLKIISNIQSEIKENIQHDDDWKKFEKNFDVVYEDFLKRLSTNYPKLTVSDKKMCAYLKMGLSSKEIAPLLDITLRSVEMNRYRLRKKLGLEREENLADFLQKF